MNRFKWILFYCILLLLPFFVLLTNVTLGIQSAYAEEAYDCANGRHKDVIISQNAPTATQSGEIIYKCELCGREYIDNVPATEHNWSDWIIDKFPTCTLPGTKHRTCSLHGTHDEVEPIPATGHNYILTKKEPTCTENGINYYTCSSCGASYSEEGDSALKHDYFEVITKEPTCTEQGEKKHACKHCGDAFTEILSPLGHSFSEWIIQEAKEGVEGLRSRECTICGFSESEAIPALPVTTTQDPVEAGNEGLFNQNDAIIAVVNIGIVLTFGAFLYPDVYRVVWHKRRYKEYLSKKTKEAQKYDFH